MHISRILQEFAFFLTFLSDMKIKISSWEKNSKGLHNQKFLILHFDVDFSLCCYKICWNDRFKKSRFQCAGKKYIQKMHFRRNFFRISFFLINVWQNIVWDYCLLCFSKQNAYHVAIVEIEKCEHFGTANNLALSQIIQFHWNVWIYYNFAWF